MRLVTQFIISLYYYDFIEGQTGGIVKVDRSFHLKVFCTTNSEPCSQGRLVAICPGTLMSSQFQLECGKRTDKESSLDVALPLNCYLSVYLSFISILRPSRLFVCHYVHNLLFIKGISYTFILPSMLRFDFHSQFESFKAPLLTYLHLNLYFIS